VEEGRYLFNRAVRAEHLFFVFWGSRQRALVKCGLRFSALAPFNWWPKLCDLLVASILLFTGAPLGCGLVALQGLIRLLEVFKRRAHDNVGLVVILHF